MWKYMLVPLLCGAVALSGCHVSTLPKTVAVLPPRGPAAMLKAPYHGEYWLYRLAPGARGAVEEAGERVASVRLRKGDPFGFKPTAEGGVIAIAGDQRFPVADGRYEWVMQADPGQIEWVRTTILVVVVVVIVVVVAGLVYEVAMVSAINSALSHG